MRDATSSPAPVHQLYFGHALSTCDTWAECGAELVRAPRICAMKIGGSGRDRSVPQIVTGGDQFDAVRQRM
ncbi:hypothetical protein CR51_17690 [Caballeronia megalochromosomata]|nr:hypothetical protein CR51_17690 [Caballeronia megalochromosomata]